MPSTRRTYLWLLTGLLLCLLSACLDTATIAWVHAHSLPFLRHASKFATRWGDFLPIIGYLAIFFLLARLLGRAEWARTFTLMFFSAVVAGACANVVRVIAGRARPSAHLAPGWYGLKTWAVLRHAHYQVSSFPSAHTAVAFGAIVPLFFFARRRYAVLGLLLASAIAASRVYSAAHHLSDVTAGAFLGTIMSLSVCFRAQWLAPAIQRVEQAFMSRWPRPVAPARSESAFS